MRASPSFSPTNLFYALALSFAVLAVAWLVLRASIVEIMPPGDPSAARLSPNAPDVVLDRAMMEFLTKRGTLSKATTAQAERAAQRAPLDARPYLFAGARDILRGQGAQAVRVLEAGRRLDGRERWIHLLLLDRYLRAGRYTDAVTEFAVLNRLVSGAQAPILAELVRMTLRPSTRDAVRRTLAHDPALESDLLIRLARSNPDPQLLWQLASPAARVAAGRPDGWGQALVETLVDRRQYLTARATWVTLFRVPPAAAGALLYNPAFQASRGSPPFAWQFASGTIGAADPRNGQLEIDYYGRDDGVLASQLLMLTPGRYRLAYGLAGGGGAGLSWTLSCAEQGAAAPFAQMPVPAATSQLRRITAEFTVPVSGCAAQWLRLTGATAEFPNPLNVTLSGLDLSRGGARQ